jgi:hypothetical protein
MYVQVERQYAFGPIVEIAAYPAYPDAEGALRNPSFGLSEPYSDLTDLRVRCYLDHRTTDHWPYGTRFEYKPHHVELPQAEGMVRVMRRLTKGMQTLQSTEGYLQEPDFAGYLLRVGRVLRVRRWYVRNTRLQEVRSGERFRLADGGVLQSWVASRIRDLGETETERASEAS